MEVFFRNNKSIAGIYPAVQSTQIQCLPPILSMITVPPVNRFRTYRSCDWLVRKNLFYFQPTYLPMLTSCSPFCLTARQYYVIGFSRTYGETDRELDYQVLLHIL